MLVSQYFVLKLCSHKSRKIIKVSMFLGSLFRRNMFVIVLFTSDVGFKHVSCMVVNCDDVRFYM